MSDPMTLEETIAKWERVNISHFEKSTLHWLTTLKAENERLAEQLDAVELSEAKYMQQAGRLLETIRAIRHEVRWTTEQARMLDALLKETEPSDG